MRYWLRSPNGVSRRALLAAVALFMGVMVLHIPLSDALMNRADGVLAAGNERDALRLYQRAAWFDADSADIADRQLFAAYMTGDDSVIRPVLMRTKDIVLRHSESVPLYVDTGLCATRVHDRALAAQAYEHAGRQGRVAQYLVLAGWSWHQSGSSERARLVWHEALKITPHYAPAMYALARTGHRS
jgi:tetratricopeptide (TPR) repeat protein